MGLARRMKEGTRLNGEPARVSSFGATLNASGNDRANSVEQEKL